ncbi:MAG: Arc-like binding protein [Massilia sp.]|nr:Arc-like binding protein [Massilia sp.]
MKKLATSQDEYIRTAIRLPPDLHASVRVAAKAAGRTMNAELIYRVSSAEEVASFKQLVRQNDELRAMMREMLDQIELLK